MAALAKSFLLALSVFILSSNGVSAQDRAMTQDAEAAVAAYVAAWREPDHAKREKLLEKAWAENGLYLDPQSEVKGRRKLSGYMGLVMQMYPSGRSVQVSRVEHRKETFRFAWRSLMPDGSLHDEGMDFGELDKQGRIKRLVIFGGALVPGTRQK